jgi:sulfate/thiosulfate transport system permease protein
MRLVVIAYLTLLLVIPLGLIAYKAFGDGLGPVWSALTDEDAVHAIRVTVVVAFWTVLANTVFGLLTALLLARANFPGKRILNALIDLPLAVSPVVVGLALILVYGSNTALGGALERHGFPIIFATPGMVLATVFVSLPLVVRSIEPVLRELGEEQEQAAHTLGANWWQTFRRITLPGIRWALAFGVVLCLARALGEYGAVAVVSGRFVGDTETLTLFVEDSYQNYNQVGAYAGATLLALLAVVSLLLTKFLRPKGKN